MINQVSEAAFISPAHASDDLQRAAGAEDEYVSVGAEGSHRVGAAPRGAEPAVSPPAECFPAAILTCHRFFPPASVDHGRFQRGHSKLPEGRSASRAAVFRDL